MEKENAFMILGSYRKQARRAGVSKEEIGREIIAKNLPDNN
jgi:hypothetical protein